MEGEKMKVRPISGERNWLFEWIEEWAQFFRNDNWYTFHIFMWELEDDKIMGGVEMTFILLGLGFRWRWNHVETEAMAECKKAIKDIEAGTAITRPWKDVKADLEKDEG